MSEEHLKTTLKALKDRFGLQESELMKYPATLLMGTRLLTFVRWYTMNMVLISCMS
jgi:hypothetical protein